MGIKSKDKLKSDKYSDLDIFSTTKKPLIPFQRHRLPSSNQASGPGTPVSSKKDEKPNDFKKPSKIEDRRRSSSSKDDKRDSKDERKEASRDNRVLIDTRRDLSRVERK